MPCIPLFKINLQAKMYKEINEIKNVLGPDQTKFI
jgi:hypothetical protein